MIQIPCGSDFQEKQSFKSFLRNRLSVLSATDGLKCSGKN